MLRGPAEPKHFFLTSAFIFTLCLLAYLKLYTTNWTLSMELGFTIFFTVIASVLLLTGAVDWIKRVKK